VRRILLQRPTERWPSARTWSGVPGRRWATGQHAAWRHACRSGGGVRDHRNRRPDLAGPTRCPSIPVRIAIPDELRQMLAAHSGENGSVARHRRLDRHREPPL